GEGGAAGGGGGRGSEVGAIGPAADGEENLEVAVTLLQQVELLEAAIQVGANVVPRVALPVDVGVGPGVREMAVACQCGQLAVWHERAWEPTLHRYQGGHWRRRRVRG